MLVNPLVVSELRALFKSGATPSALIRRIADRHAGEPRLDALVRAYFSEAFHVPMIRIGLEQVKQIAEGGSLAILNVTVLPRMIQTRREWDLQDGSGGRSDGCWLDAVATTDEAALVAAADPKLIPELAGSWDRMDDEAQQFIKRIIGNSHSSHEKVNALAALAERVQQQVAGAAARSAQGA
jgi:hypothetical protein